MYVDLPAILGPVIMFILSSAVFKKVSLGTKLPESINLSTTGCLPSFIIISFDSSTSGITYEFTSATSAKEHSVSIVATALLLICKRSICVAIFSLIFVKISYSRLTTLS